MNTRDEKIISKITRLIETDDSIDAPSDSIKWAKNIFRTRSFAQPERSVIQKVLAVLQMDLSPNKAAFGERSASSFSAAKSRQMLFQAGDAGSVDLRINAAGAGNFNLRGQILGEGFSGCVVKLGDFETTANELSEFSFSNVAGGEYDLTVQSSEAEITIEDLEIK